MSTNPWYNPNSKIHPSHISPVGEKCTEFTLKLHHEQRGQNLFQVVSQVITPAKCRAASAFPDCSTFLYPWKGWSWGRGGVQSLWEQVAHTGADGKRGHLPLLGALTTILRARGLHFQLYNDKVENTDIKNYWKKRSGLRLWNFFFKVWNVVVTILSPKYWHKL